MEHPSRQLDTAPESNRHLFIAHIACYSVVVTVITIYTLTVGGTLWEYCCLLMASEGMLATTRLVCGVFPEFNDRRFPALTIVNVLWILVSCWIALGTIFMGRLPLVPTVYVLAFISIPEIWVQMQNPESDIYRRPLTIKRELSHQNRVASIASGNHVKIKSH